MNFYNYMMKHYRQGNGEKIEMNKDREQFPKNGVGKFDGYTHI